jgi:hypothetical protein
MRTHKKQPRRRRLFVERLESRELLSSSPIWSGFAGNAQHTGLAAVQSQPLDNIRWQTPIDLQPQFSGNDLLIHYGEPMVTAANTVLIPVKTNAIGGFRIEARSGADGTIKWIQNTDYILPNSSWTPSFDAVLTPTNRLYFAGAGGTVYFTDNPDSNNPTFTQVAFYGLSNYQANPGSFNATVFVDTPMTSDSHGNIFFGFRVQGIGPTVGGVPIHSGIARIAASGSGIWTSATTAANDPNIGIVPHNAAPALSNDETTLYVPVRSATTSGYGFLLGWDPTTLALKQNGSGGPMKVLLQDPRPVTQPILGATFAGLASGSSSCNGCEPPDTMVAAGPSNVVEMVNASMLIASKTGTTISTTSLANLFPLPSSLPPGTQRLFQSNPFVIFDDNISNGVGNPSGRFIVGALDIFSNQVTDFLDFAVSNDWDATHGFTTHPFSNVSEDFFLADYPRVGYNADAVFISFNLFNATGAFDHPEILAIQTSTITSGAASTYTSFHHDLSNNLFTVVPAMMHGASPGGPEYFVSAPSSALSGGASDIHILTESNVLSNTPTDLDNDIVVNPYNNAIPVMQPNGSVFPASGKIDARVLSAAWRNNILVADQTIGFNSTTDHVRWYQLSTASTLSLTQQGDVSAANGGSTFYPSIDIAANNNLGLTYMQSSSTEFVSMYVTGRTPTDPTGTMEVGVRAFAGTANYNGTLAGAYSGTSVDPATGTSFWSANEFVTSNSVASWSTGIANFSLSPLPIFSNATIPDISTSSPMVGPDGDVYYGVFGSTYDGSRGWMLHFNRDLTIEKTPGAFGWDDTASIVPASLVPSYQGTSTYLLMTKYNNYAGPASFELADGVNKIAILDPNATETDPHPSSNGVSVMREIMTIAGPTPDANFRSSGFPNAVREWCINSAVVDPFTVGPNGAFHASVLANSEDGKLYRWDLLTDSFTQVVTLTPGIGEAYTPTFMGPDGTVYAINDATLFAVGGLPIAAASDALTVTRGTTAVVNATFTVTLTNPTNDTATVPYFTSDGTATAGRDYVSTSGTLTFTPGTTSLTVNVPILPGTAYHAPRTFFLNLGNPTNARVLQSQAVGTIIVSPSLLPTISITNTSVTQSTTDVINAVFTVTLTGATEESSSVSFNTTDGTAVSGLDYSTVSGTLNFAPGTAPQTQTIVVPVLASAADASPLTFNVVLLNPPVNATIDPGHAQAQGTILNTPPVISIGSVSAPAGDSGTTPFNFTISLSRPSRRPITVTYATADGTAQASADYNAVGHTTVTFAPNQTAMSVTVLVNGTTVSQPDKTFFVKLSNPLVADPVNPVAGTIGVGQGTGTILNHNGALTISDVTAQDRPDAAVQFIFSVRLQNASINPISVDVSAVDGTAHAPADYTPLATTLNFAPGQTFLPVSVIVPADRNFHPSTNFFVNLSNPVNAVLMRAQGIGNIVSGVTPGSLQFSAATYSVRESRGSVNIVITRAGGSTGSISVHFATSGGTAVPNVAYVPTSGTLSFADGQTSASFPITILDDGVISLGQTVNVVLTSPTGGATLGTQSQAILQIFDSDGTPNQRFIMQLYRDLLGREVDPGGFSGWTSILNSGVSRTQVVRMLEDSTEYRTKFVSSVYMQILRRPVDPTGLNMGLGILASGAVGAADQLRAILLGSDEYFNRIGGRTNAGFIQALYHDLLNRDADTLGAQALEQYLANGGDRTQAAGLYLTTPEAAGVLVAGLYQHYLHRQPAPSELPGYEFVLGTSQLSEFDVAAIIAGSGEYLANV